MFQKTHLYLTALLSLLCLTQTAEAIEVVAGPMVGDTGTIQSNIWLQTDQSGRVQIRYWPENQSNQMRSSKVYVTDAERFITTVVPLTGLKTGHKYFYQVLLNDKVQAFPYPLSFSTAPIGAANIQRLPEIKALIGSCYFINDPVMKLFNVEYGSGLDIFASMAKKEADLMLWMGDNVYFAPFDLSNLYNMNQRYKVYRQAPELQPLLAKMPHYATWDDHDFGPNNSDKNFWRRNESFKLFKAYWPNPRYGLLAAPGTFFNKVWGDLEFFVTDNRFYREANDHPNPMKRDFFGPEQLSWLKSSLKASKATFKLVVIASPVLNRYYSESFAKATGEYQNLMTFLEQEKIEGVVFLSGDRHHSDLTRLDRPGAYPLYNYVSSPLTSHPSESLPKLEETDSYRVPGSLITKRNFGYLRVTGPQGQRTLHLEAYDTQGKKIWLHQINQEELSYPR